MAFTSSQYISSLNHETIFLNPSEIFVLENKNSPGYIVKNNFLGYDASHEFLEYMKNQTELKFNDAGMGSKDNYWKQQKYRGDAITWLKSDSSSTLSALDHLLNRTDCLVRDLALKIPSFELSGARSIQYSIFPGNGERFVKHVDASKNMSPSRCITCIYYLNHSWKVENGGQLRIYSKNQHVLDILPTLDKLVILRSEDVEHEVLPCFRTRQTITIWYYSREKKQEVSQLLNYIDTFLDSKINSKASDVLLFKESLIKIKDQTSTFSTPSISSSIINTHSLERVQIDEDDQETIFVSIPSYRDPECQHTLNDLYAKASFPHRISVGICWQYDVYEDEKCFTCPMPDQYQHQIRVLHLQSQDASGPCTARYLIQKLWRNEKYYLQIDSHMRFKEGWDTFLIYQLKQCPSTKPILTTYPPHYHPPYNLSKEIRPIILCAKHFCKQNHFRQEGKVLKNTFTNPLKHPFWAAGFSFSSSQVIQEVPYDPCLKFLFFGEEISMAFRLFTYGYDFYSPSSHVIFHLWSRSYRPFFRTDIQNGLKHSLEQLSLQNIQSLFKPLSNTNFHEKKIGNIRSIQEFEEICGVDLQRQKVLDKAKWGGFYQPQEFDKYSEKEINP